MLAPRSTKVPLTVSSSRIASSVAYLTPRKSGQTTHQKKIPAGTSGHLQPKVPAGIPNSHSDSDVFSYVLGGRAAHTEHHEGARGH